MRLSILHTLLLQIMSYLENYILEILIRIINTDLAVICTRYFVLHNKTTTVIMLDWIKGFKLSDPSEWNI